MLVSRDLFVAIAGAIALHATLFLLDPPTHGIPIEIASPTKPQSWTISKIVVLASTTTNTLVAPNDRGAKNIEIQSHPPSSSPQPGLDETQKVLSSTPNTGWNFSDFHEIDEVDTPAVPASDWILPIKKGYLNDVIALVVRVWIQSDGSIAGAELLDIGKSNLSSNQMQEIVDWLASTPMTPATKNGENVASRRTIEIAFEH